MARAFRPQITGVTPVKGEKEGRIQQEEPQVSGTSEELSARLLGSLSIIICMLHVCH